MALRASLSLLLLGLLLPRIAHGGKVPEQPPVRLAQELLQSPDDQVNIGNAALTLSTLVSPNADLERATADLGVIAARVKRLVAGRTDPDFRIRAINTVLFQEFGFRYDFEGMNEDLRGQRPQTRTLWNLLETRRGNCVSLPVLWYAVAERLHYPVFAVNAPQHVFLRYDDGSFRSNIEATSGGGEGTDEKIIHELEIPEEGVRSGAYMRSLTKREFLAVLVGDAISPFLKARNLDVAIPVLESALQSEPRSVEMHWGLALAYKFKELRSGDLQAKARATEHAKAATFLGAAAPLKENYWNDFVAQKLAERRTPSFKPRPFDVVSWLNALDAAERSKLGAALQFHSLVIVERPPAAPPWQASVGPSGLALGGGTALQPTLPDPRATSAALSSIPTRSECEQVLVTVEDPGSPGSIRVPANSRCLVQGKVIGPAGPSTQEYAR